MRDLLNWWFNWGAIVFLVTTIFIAALVIFDSVQRRASAIGWQLGVILPPVIILFSVIYKTQLDKPVPLDSANAVLGTAEFLFWLGAIAGLISVIDAIGYFMVATTRPAPMPPIYDVRPNNFNNQRPTENVRDDKTRGVNGGPAASRPMTPGSPVNGMLVHSNGHGGPQRYQLYEGRNTIGRAVSNVIVIDDPDVSRDHAHIETQQRHFMLADHGSTHGTYVNGKRIAGKVYLQDDDVIRLGPSVGLTFKSW